MRRRYLSTRVRLGLALGFSSLVSTGLYMVGPWDRYEPDFIYMIWNLFLAWLGFAAALVLERALHRSVWSSWYVLLLTALWLIFLPNTFYMLTDFIHIHELTMADLVQGVIMLSSFILNGVILGLLSVHIVHRELIKRVKARTAWTLVGFTLLICSFAIYVGRELRWNTWDIILNPTSVLFDVSERLLNPAAHLGMLSITLGFFALLLSLYTVAWHMARASRQQPE
jgi:uncharacterized membrane protein